MEAQPENLLAKYVPSDFEIQEKMRLHPVYYYYRHKQSGCPMAIMAGGHKGIIIGGVVYYREQHDSMNMEIESTMDGMGNIMRFVEEMVRTTQIPKDGIEGIWSRFHDNLNRTLIEKNFYTKEGVSVPKSNQEEKKKESPVDKKRIKLDESAQEEECMICMERPPDTMVTPCMHNVVCSVCSVHLENSIDAKTCCRCRCEISGVYYPDNTVKNFNH